MSESRIQHFISVATLCSSSPTLASLHFSSPLGVVFDAHGDVEPGQWGQISLNGNFCTVVHVNANQQRHCYLTLAIVYGFSDHNFLGARDELSQYLYRLIPNVTTGPLLYTQVAPWSLLAFVYT